MSTSSTVQEQNRELAERINEEALADPNSPYAGKFVGIANGQVVVVGYDLDEVIPVLEQVEPDPQKTFFIEAGRDYTEVIGFPFATECAGGTTMPTSPPVPKENRELAERINEEALANPNSAYAGKFVGIANGQVAVVADDLNEVVRVLDQVEPDPQKTFIIEAGLDYNEPVEIWSVC